MAKQETIGFIGGGNMAEAIVRGLLAAGTPASAVTVAEPRAARRRQLAKRFGVGATDDSAVAADARTLLLAVKPQTLPAVFDELGGRIGKRTVVVSIAAGVRLAKLERGLGRGTRVVRCMPNTPCLVGRGASVLCAGKAATRADLARARRIFDTVGIVRTVERESLLDAVTALPDSAVTASSSDSRSTPSPRCRAAVRPTSTALPRRWCAPAGAPASMRTWRPTWPSPPFPAPEKC